jgi:hypothetical protein
MVKKHMRADDGMYHVKGKKYQTLIGSRPMVWHGNAYKTKGDLVKSDFLMNKHGRIVSQKKHKSAKKDKRLEKAGYFTKKGQFGYVRRDSKSSSSSSSRSKPRKAKKTRKARRNRK